MSAVRQRRRGVVLGSFIALAFAVALSISVGARVVALADSWPAVFGFGGDHVVSIVRELRLPRTIVAVQVGAALGVAGALMQSLTRNPLAEPGLLGVNAGASFAIVVGVGWLGVSSPTEATWIALAGAALAAALVLALGRVGRGAGGAGRLVLAGVSLSASLASIINALVLLDPQVYDLQRDWVVGSLAMATTGTAVTAAPFLGVGFIVAVLIAPGLDALELGDDSGRSLGVPVALIRILALIAITVLAGSATAAAGPIAFVGLVAPQAARLVGGVGVRWSIACSALLGPVVLLLADVVGRVAAPGELPVGIVVAVIGAPAFLIIVRRARGVVV